jgi:hypothetical protein
MTGMMNAGLLSERLLAAIGTFFAVVALTLAALGVYGLLSHIVARRGREIGVRIAVGARPVEMIWMTLRDTLTLAGIGVAVGISAAVAGLRVLDGLLFGLSPTDAVTLMTAALLLLLVSIAAAVVPRTPRRERGSAHRAAIGVGRLKAASTYRLLHHLYFRSSAAFAGGVHQRLASRCRSSSAT